MFVCNPPAVRAFQFISSVAMIAAGVYLVYRASRGRVIPFAAVIGKERILWTKIVATVLVVIGALLFLAALIRLDC